MALTADLKIKGQIKLTAAGAVEVSVFKQNNFADTLLIAVTDEVPVSDNDNVAGLRVYTTGKEPTNPVLTFTPLGLTQNQDWDISLTFANTAGDQVLNYIFTGASSSTVDNVYTFELQGKSTKAN